MWKRQMGAWTFIIKMGFLCLVTSSESVPSGSIVPIPSLGWCTVTDASTQSYDFDITLSRGDRDNVSSLYLCSVFLCLLSHWISVSVLYTWAHLLLCFNNLSSVVKSSSLLSAGLLTESCSFSYIAALTVQDESSLLLQSQLGKASCQLGQQESPQLFLTLVALLAMNNTEAVENIQIQYYQGATMCHQPATLEAVENSLHMGIKWTFTDWFSLWFWSEWLVPLPAHTEQG